MFAENFEAGAVRQHLRENRTSQHIAEYMIEDEGLPTRVKHLSALPLWQRFQRSHYSFRHDSIYLSEAVWDCSGATRVGIITQLVEQARQRHTGFTILGIGYQGLTNIVLYFYLLLFPALIYYFKFVLTNPASQPFSVLALILCFVLCFLMRPFVMRMVLSSWDGGISKLSANDSNINASMLNFLGLSEKQMRKAKTIRMLPYRLSNFGLPILFVYLIHLGVAIFI